MTTTVRVVVADDHPVVREGLRALLDSLPHVQVVGEASTGEAAIRQTAATRPDVVLMDLHMPGVNGVEATRRIRRLVPDTAVLVLTMLEDDEWVFAAMRAGARGYLLKGATQEVIARAIQTVADGGASFGPHVAARVLGLLTDPRIEDVPFPELTDREREVLDLIAGGSSNAAIAGRLHISAKTVSNHISNIFAKLHLTDRAQAIVRAREAGLGRT